MNEPESQNTFSPARNLLRFLSRAERLEAFPRTGWQVCGVQHPESVAAHSFNMTLVALWICDHVDEEVNTEEVLRIALLHDLPEAMLTDLPRPVKRLLGYQACKDAEEAAAARIFEHHPPSWFQAFQHYQQALSLEARIVKAADRIQMLAKALQYRSEQRGRTERFFDHHQDWDDFGIPLVAEIYSELLRHFQGEPWFAPDFE